MPKRGPHTRNTIEWQEQLIQRHYERIHVKYFLKLDQIWHGLENHPKGENNKNDTKPDTTKEKSQSFLHL